MLTEASREKRFLSAHSSRLQSTLPRRPQWQELEGAGHTKPIVRIRGQQWMQLVLFCLSTAQVLSIIKMSMFPYQSKWSRQPSQACLWPSLPSDSPFCGADSEHWLPHCPTFSSVSWGNHMPRIAEALCTWQSMLHTLWVLLMCSKVVRMGMLRSSVFRPHTWWQSGSLHSCLPGSCAFLPTPRFPSA